MPEDPRVEAVAREMANHRGAPTLLAHAADLLRAADAVDPLRQVALPEADAAMSRLREERDEARARLAEVEAERDRRDAANARLIRELHIRAEVAQGKRDEARARMTEMEADYVEEAQAWKAQVDRETARAEAAEAERDNYRAANRAIRRQFEADRDTLAGALRQVKEHVPIACLAYQIADAALAAVEGRQARDDNAPDIDPYANMNRALREGMDTWPKDEGREA